jgi:hypothetical protein
LFSSLCSVAGAALWPAALVGPLWAATATTALRTALLGGAVPESAADGCAECKRRTLKRRGREREPDGVEVGVGDDRKPEGIRQTAFACLSLGGKRLHRLDQGFEAERGANLADEAPMSERAGRRRFSRAAVRPRG